MRKIVIFSAFILIAFVACNNKSSSTVATPPPPTPSNQCLVAQTAVNNTYYNPYTYSNGYNNYYNYANVYNNGTTCTNQIYNDYHQYGFAPYPHTNLYNYGAGYSYLPLCNCPANYRPVYNGTIGMGCVAIQYFDPIAVGAYYWSLTPNNYQWVNWTQVSNTTTVIGNQSNCYQQVAISCFTDQANTCGSGYVCRATAGGSRLGVCVQQ